MFNCNANGRVRRWGEAEGHGESAQAREQPLAPRFKAISALLLSWRAHNTRCDVGAGPERKGEESESPIIDYADDWPGWKMRSDRFERA